ncbi:MAG: YeeE/YedE family protein [Phycisphaerales bacterium]|nr:YeeE/YedE family protein [Phycisphaerales bacterium]
MFENFFAGWEPVLMGAGIGLVFGFLLQKAAVTRYQTILGQFLFKDFTVLKVMLTAIVVGGIGIYAMRAMNPDMKMHIKNAALLGNVVGGLIFGVGMAILGYCPGTGTAALGDGSRHVIPGLLGMIVGAGVYAEVYPFIKDGLLKIGVITVDETSKVSLPQLTHLSPWWFLAALTVIAVVVFLIIERAERRSKAKPADSV